MPRLYFALNYHIDNSGKNTFYPNIEQFVYIANIICLRIKLKPLWNESVMYVNKKEQKPNTGFNDTIQTTHMPCTVFCCAFDINPQRHHGQYPLS